MTRYVLAVTAIAFLGIYGIMRMSLLIADMGTIDAIADWLNAIEPAHLVLGVAVICALLIGGFAAVCVAGELARGPRR